MLFQQFTFSVIANSSPTACLNGFWTASRPLGLQHLRASALLFIALFLQVTVAVAQGGDSTNGSTRAAVNTPVGFVIISRGDAIRVEANTQKIHVLKRRSKIFSGDEVATGPKSGLQIKFTDGSIIALKANTRLQIAHFSYAPNDDSSRSFFALLEGGIRAISGAIGKQNPEQYRLKTPVATIGIRGTHYAVALDKEMVVGVWDGGINVSNRAGSISLGADSSYRFASISAVDQKPVGLQQAPKVLTDLMNSTQPDPSELESGDDSAAAFDGTDESSIDDGPKPISGGNAPGQLSGNLSGRGALAEIANGSDIQQADILQAALTRDDNGDGTIDLDRIGDGTITPPGGPNDANYPLSSLFTLSASSNPLMASNFGNSGVRAGTASTGNDPTLVLFGETAQTASTPIWYVNNSASASTALNLIGRQSSLVPSGVSFGRWDANTVAVRNALLNPTLDEVLAPPAYWMTADLTSSLPIGLPQSYRISTPLFFSGDTNVGTDALRVAILDLTIDFNNPSALTGELMLVSQGSGATYEHALWDLDLSGSLSDRELRLAVNSANSTLDQSGTVSSIGGELRGYLVEDGASLVSAIKLFDANGGPSWLNGIFAGTGLESRLPDTDLGTYRDRPAVTLAASVSNNNLGATSPLFRHDAGVFAGPAILDANDNLLRFADLWQFENMSATDIFGIEYFVEPGATVGLLANVTPVDPIGNGITLPQMPTLHRVNAWSAPTFLFDPQDANQNFSTAETERLIWLTASPASLNQLDSTRLALFDTVAYAYFEDRSAAAGSAFNFSIDGSALADFNNGAVTDFKLTIRTDTEQYDLTVPSSLFRDNANNNVASIDLSDAGVRGTVCTLSDCANTRRDAHGELRLTFLEGGQTIGGSIKLWDDANLETWVAGVFTLAEDTRLANTEVTALSQQGKHAIVVQGNDTARLTNQNTNQTAYTLSGRATTDAQGAPTLLKDSALSYEGTILRTSNLTNQDVNSGTVGGQTVGWGRWNAADSGSRTIVQDFVNAPGQYNEDLYWISAQPTPAAQLPTGEFQYNQNVRMLGQLNGQPIVTNPSSGTSFTVNFDAMSINGTLGISNGVTDDVTINVSGNLDGPLLQPTNIQVLTNNTPVVSAITEFHGVITGDNGEGMAGGWHAHDPATPGGNALDNTSGVFLLER